MLLRYIAICLVLFTASAFAGEDAPLLIATVNGDSITSDMLAEELGRIHSAQTSAVERSDFSVDRLLNKLITNRLIVQDALALGMDEEKSVTDAVRWFREVMAFDALIKDIQPETIPVTDQEVREAFEKFYRRAMIRLICVTDSALSVAIVDSIHQGVSMASLSRNHAIDKYKDLGGDAGIYPLFDLPEDLVKQMEAAPVGTIIGPMFLWRTWAAVRADAFVPADEAIFDSVQVLVRKQIMIDNAAKLRNDFIAREGANIPLWIDSVKVDSIIVRMAMGLEATKDTVAKVGTVRSLLESDLRQKYIHRIVGRDDREKYAVLHETLDEQIQVMQLKEIATLKQFVEDPRFDQEALTFRDSMLVVNYLQSVVGPTVKVTDDEISTFYQANLNQFRKPGRVRVATVTRATLEETQADYEKVLAGADFAWIAEQYSTDEFKSRGGLRDWEGLEKFPPSIATQLDTLTIGTCLPPLAGQEGFTLLKLIEREPGGLRTLAESRETIKSMVERQKQFQAIDATVTDLRAAANITINEQALQEQMITGPDGE